MAKSKSIQLMKALSIFKLTEWSAPSAADLEAALSARHFIPATPAAEQSIGWLMPRGVDFSAYLETHEGHWLAELCIEQKSVPASKIKAELKKRCAVIEARDGRKPGRKEKADLKLEIKRDLLPRAFSRENRVSVWLDTTRQLLMVGSTSNSVLDTVIDELTSILSELGSMPGKLERADSTTSVQGEMTAWLMAKSAPGEFNLHRELLLKEVEDKCAVRYADHNLEIDEVAGHLNSGKVPMEMALMHSDTLVFSLTPALQLKKLRMLDPDESKDSEAAEDMFEASFFIFVSVVGQAIEDLLNVLDVSFGE